MQFRGEGVERRESAAGEYDGSHSLCREVSHGMAGTETPVAQGAGWTIMRMCTEDRNFKTDNSSLD